MVAEPERLLTFYRVGLHAYDGDRSLWERDIQRLMTEGGVDSYHSWFGDRSSLVPARTAECDTMNGGLFTDYYAEQSCTADRHLQQCGRCHGPI